MAMSKRSFVSLIFVIMILTGCTGVKTDPDATPVVDIPTFVPATQEPVPTDIPLVNKVLFAAGNQLPDSEVQQITAALQELSVADGLMLEMVPALSPELITPEVKIAITLPPDPGISDLSGRYPSVSFISIAVPGIQPGGNLFVAG